MTKEDCLIKGCDNLAHTRGLCAKHYQKYVYRVRMGKTTWEELENRGLILPAKSEVIDDEPESPKRDLLSRLKFNAKVIHPDPSVKKTTKKEVLLQVKEVLKANDLDDLVILIFNSKK